MNQKVNLADKLALFDDHWQPKIVGRYNDNDLRVVKVRGEFVWHTHNETDDFFLVLDGHLTIQLRDGELDAGEFLRRPPWCRALPARSRGGGGFAHRADRTVNTGDAGGPLTAVPEEL